MSADLVTRLRETLLRKPDGSLSGGVKFVPASLIEEAADRIEELEAHDAVARAEANILSAIHAEIEGRKKADAAGTTIFSSHEGEA